MSVSYDRTPSDKLRRLFDTGGLLAPLLNLSERQVCGLPLDIFFRVKDEVHIYCGLTQLIRVKRYSNGTVKVSAHKTYSEQSCAIGLFRRWSINEHTEFEKSLDRYLCRVKVDSRHTKYEGSIQSLWSRVTECWVPFDKEVVLGYSSKEESKAARRCGQVESACAELQDIARTASPPWAFPPCRGSKIDQLAVDSTGSLVLVELKDASASLIFYAPFQILSYIWEWHNAIQSVLSQLQALLDSRVDLGLISSTVPKLTGDIRAAVCFGPDTRSDEVKRRYSKVLDVQNRYLPPGFPPIDTWMRKDSSTPPQLVRLA